MSKFMKYITLLAIMILLGLAGCGKKEKKTAIKPPVKAVKAVKATAKVSKPKVEPPPTDLDLKAGQSVVAWLSIRSMGAAFDAVETVASRAGVVPPGVSIRGDVYEELTMMLAQQGISGHSWLDKTKPLHIFMQDDDAQDPQSALVLLLPVNGVETAMAALKTAKVGAEAKGHSALLSLGPRPAFIDFLGKYMVLTSSEQRFAKAKSFAQRIIGIKSPSLLYLGVSLVDLSLIRRMQLEAMMAQLLAQGGGRRAKARPGASAGSLKSVQKWTSSLLRAELLIDANSENVQLETRLHPKAKSKLAEQWNAGRGRDALPLAVELPGTTYFTALGSVEPRFMKPFGAELSVALSEMGQLDEVEARQLAASIDTTLKLADGTTALALYRDGDAAVGMTGFVGASDPEAVAKVAKRVASMVALQIVENVEVDAQKRERKKSPDPRFARLKAGLKEQNIEPLLGVLGPVAKELGVALSTNSNKDGGAHCDVLDMQFDWSKLAKHGQEQTRQGKLLFGDRTAISLCRAGKRIALSVGPSALEQARRVVLRKPAGLVSAPIYKAATERTVKRPSTFAYLNTGMAMSSIGKTMVPLLSGAGFPADRPMVLGCSNRAQSYSCQLDVPVQVMNALRKALARP